ncbi:MAG: LicD family protein [Clostridia bacterium]|nr:LicD family protein [Clostridia bacterium]
MEYEENVLRKLQNTELEILIEIDRVCRKHRIRYMLTGGTLLGAVRHKGFIPWDDDIDIIMPIRDFYRFCDVCKLELSERFFLQTILTDNFYHFWAKIRKNNTLMEESDYPFEIHQGIWVDIFPIIGVDDSPEKIKKIKDKMIDFIQFMIECRSSGPFKRMSFDGILRFIPKKIQHFLVRKRFRLFLKKVFLSIPKPILFCIQEVKLKRLFDSVKDAGMWCYIAGDDFEIDARYPSEIIDDTTELEFEGKLFPVPSNYDLYLTMLYGDYMTPPPINERKGGVHFVTRLDFGDVDQ